MAPYVSILSSPIQRHYVTHSRFSHAFLFYLVYCAGIVAVPFIVVFATPISLPSSVEFRRSEIQFTGNYFLSANGFEASSSNPIPGVDFSVASMDSDQDSIYETFVVTINSNKFISAQTLFFALEFVDSNNVLHPLSGKISDSNGGNRATAWFDVPDIGNKGDMPSIGITAALSKPGAMGLTKVSGVAAALREAKFVSFWQTIPNSSTFSCTITVENVLQSIFIRPSVGEVFRTNLMYFVILYLLNYVVLKTCYSLLVKSGALGTPMIQESCCHRK